jgi:hypothetical protein
MTTTMSLGEPTTRIATLVQIMAEVDSSGLVLENFESPTMGVQLHSRSILDGLSDLMGRLHDLGNHTAIRFKLTMCFPLMDPTCY